MSLFGASASTNSPALSEHEQFILGVDWSATDIGHPSTWPEQLSQAVDFVLADPTPASVMWGELLTMIYNKHFVEFAGAKHPRLMGSTPIIEYAEVWSMFVDIIERGRNHGQATRHEDVRLYLDRNGFLEECFVTYTFIPLKESNRSVVGFYHTAVETTREVRAARRTRTLLALGDILATSRNVKDYWANLLQGFEHGNADFHWAVAYSFNKDTAIEKDVHSRMHTPKSCSLMGKTKTVIGETPQEIHLDDRSSLLAQSIEQSMRLGKVLVLDRSNCEPVSGLFDPGSQDSQTSSTALLIPVKPVTTAKQKSVDDFGFLVLGLAHGVSYDEDCVQFIKLLSRQNGTSAANAVFFEEEALRQQQLVQQLSTSSQRARASEERLSRFFEVTNIGMWIASPKGELMFANKAWYEQAKLDPNVQDMCVEKWVSLVSEDSLKTFGYKWGLLTEKYETVTFECQFKTVWESRDPGTGEPIQGSQWFLISALPEFHPDGSIKNFWGCNVDVSFQKWYQAQVNNRLQETLEAKRQTENFIDMVSHEIRNPLSAITQSADSISSIIAGATRALASFSRQTDVRLEDADINSISESASIILTCASHQKTIVDDILTLSKLDASLLTVTLEEVDPVEIIQDALKLHQQQFETSMVHGVTHIDSAYQNLNIGRVHMDRNRVFQVLINLLTNAIKFTRLQPVRRVTLRLSASSEKPKGSDFGVNWLDSRQAAKPKSDLEGDLGKDEVYIHFAVEDTGCGMTDEEMEHLFIRFSQASPKTQVRYGIVELQGGRIGLTSLPGQGSVFRFFLKVQRAFSAEQAIQNSRENLARSLSNEQAYQQRGNKLNESEANGNGSGLTVSSVESKLSLTKPVSSPKPPPSENSSASNMNVLVVEDNMINQKLLANQLRKCGCIVSCANHGAEALAFLERTAFANGAPADAIPLSIILMDIEMPVMDGLTCVATIRQLQDANQLTRKVPVIAVTANARPEHVQKAKDHGMDDVIIKPFHIKDLVARMYKLLADQ